MDEQQESTFVLKPGVRIFSRAPYELFLLNFLIGVMASVFYPAMSLRIEDKHGVRGIFRVAPTLTLMIGLFISRTVILKTRYSFGVTAHLILGCFFLVSSAGILGAVDVINQPLIFWPLILTGRLLQGIGSGYVTSLSNHILIEDPLSEYLRKRFLQVSLLFGMIVGYPLIIYIDYLSIVYWALGGCLVFSMIIVIVNKEGDKLTSFKFDRNMNISVTDIAFRRRGMLAFFTVAMANIIPVVLVFAIPELSSILKLPKYKLMILYLLQGGMFLISMTLRACFYSILGSRIGVSVGNCFLVVGIYLIWPLQNDNPSEMLLYGGVACCGFGIGFVNMFAAIDIVAFTSNYYRINIRYIRNSVLRIFSTANFISSILGLLIAGLFVTKANQKIFLKLLFFVQAGAAIAYITTEGWRGFSIVSSKSFRSVDTALNFADNKSSTERTALGGKSLIEQENQQLTKEKYINITMFLGKYFLPDSFSTSTPFVIFG